MRLPQIPELSGGDSFRGHIPELARDRFAFLARVAAEVKDVAVFRTPTRDILFVSSPEALHEVLVEKARHFEKSPQLRTALYPLAGEGLFTSGGQLWRRQRRLMAPVFHHAKIDALAPIMVDCAVAACERMPDGATLDIATETTRIAMSVAGRTLFGIDTSDEADVIGHALTIALHWADRASMSLLVSLQVELRLALLDATVRSAPVRRAFDRWADRLEPPIMWPTPGNFELKRAIALLDERVQRMIDQRRAKPAERQDLLSYLLDARDEDGSMSDKQVRDEILTLFVAGHETTATGLAWSIYLLARHPEHYARARACVDALGGRTPSFADLESLDYLSRVFKEALRMYPPVYMYARMSVSPVEIAGYQLPAHTIVLISPWTVQHRADVWPEPLRFDPERFTESEIEKRHSNAWIPFSDGPRVCIGAHFAELEAPLVLATLLQHADFELVSDVELVPDEAATLRPRGGVPVRIKTRPKLSA